MPVGKTLAKDVDLRSGRRGTPDYTALILANCRDEGGDPGGPAVSSPKVAMDRL